MTRTDLHRCYSPISFTVIRNIRVCVILIRSTSLFCMVFITVLYDLACHKPPYKKPHHSGPC
ncbi:hypothetical protein E8D80_02075 [Escherichia coli]|nr:hypothetical protein [Escherichia coli]